MIMQGIIASLVTVALITLFFWLFSKSEKQ